jgi:DNA-binding XRE family transcriptional regulator
MASIEDHQDWTPVVLHKRREHHGSERTSMARLDSVAIDTDEPKKRVAPETIQSLIRKRMELCINQDRADQVCQFPRHTFRDIESHRILPTLKQIAVIQKLFGVSVRITNVPPPPPSDPST